MKSIPTDNNFDFKNRMALSMFASDQQGSQPKHGELSMKRRNIFLSTLSALAIAGAVYTIAPSFNGHSPLVSVAYAYEEKTYEAMSIENSARWAKLGFETRMVKVNGVNIHMAIAGKGEPLVLLHGYPQSGEIWRHVAPELAKSRQVIIPDLRGFGLSEIAKDGYDLSTVAEDIHQLVAALGHSKVEVIGHDWGGAVGVIYALRYRDEVTKLAFIESAVAGAGFEDVWSYSKPNPAMTFIPFLLSGQLTEDLMKDQEDIFLKHLWTTFTANKQAAPFETWKPYVEAMRRPGLIQSSASYYRSVYGEVDTIRALIAKGKLTIPVMSVSGKASFGDFQKGFVEAFASNIVGHVTVDGAGHFVAEEQPEALLTALRPFFTK
jgi:pimeloyl-ACP methyl ester carboxylesterase